MKKETWKDHRTNEFDLGEEEHAEIEKIGHAAGGYWAEFHSKKRQIERLVDFCDGDVSYSVFNCSRCNPSIEMELAMAILGTTDAEEAEKFWDSDFNPPEGAIAVEHMRNCYILSKGDVTSARENMLFYKKFCEGAIATYEHLHLPRWD